MKQTNGKVVTYHKQLPPTKSHEPLNSSDIRSLNHHSRNVCGYQTSQNDNILPEAPIYKAEWLFNDVIFRGHNILYILLLKTNMQQASQVADSVWEASILKVTWRFDHVNNINSNDKLKQLYLHFHKTYVT